VLNAGGYYTDQSSQFLNNSADVGGAYLAEKSSNSLFISSIFLENHADLEAGVCSISGPASIAVFQGCLIANNSAYLKAGAAIFEKM
jgi:hypothetical protein